MKGLKLLHVDFRQHMVSANNAHEKPVVSEEILSQILSNIGSLYILNSELLKELEARMSNWWVCMYLSITIKCFYYFSHILDISIIVTCIKYNIDSVVTVQPNHHCVLLCDCVYELLSELD